MMLVTIVIVLANNFLYGACQSGQTTVVENSQTVDYHGCIRMSGEPVVSIGDDIFYYIVSSIQRAHDKGLDTLVNVVAQVVENQLRENLTIGDVSILVGAVAEGIETSPATSNLPTQVGLMNKALSPLTQLCMHGKPLDVAKIVGAVVGTLDSSVLNQEA